MSSSNDRTVDNRVDILAIKVGLRSKYFYIDNHKKNTSVFNYVLLVYKFQYAQDLHKNNAIFKLFIIAF